MKNPWHPRNPIARKKLHLKKTFNDQYAFIKKTAVDSLTEITVNQSASKKDTASTLDPTIPTDVSNVNVPQKKKQKKNAIISPLGPHCNPKRKNNLDEDPDDCNVPHPPAVETNVPT
jgi:hypothetical protein